MAVGSERHAESGKSKRVGDKVWAMSTVAQPDLWGMGAALPRAPRTPLDGNPCPPPRGEGWRGTLRHYRNVPLEETSSGLGSIEPGNDTSKSSMPKKLFPGPYISKQVSAECLRIVPDPSWAPTSVCLVYNGQTQAAAEPHLGRGIVAVGEGEGTVPFLQRDASSLGWELQRAWKSPLPSCAWDLLARSRHHTLPELRHRRKRRYGGGQAGLAHLYTCPIPIGQSAIWPRPCHVVCTVLPFLRRILFRRTYVHSTPSITCHPCVKPKATDPFALVTEAT